MQKNGFTIPELLIVIFVVGVFSLIAIHKVSYAFMEESTVVEDTEELILKKTSIAYANTILDSVKENDVYITGQDLIEAGFLVDENHTMASQKVKISYNTTADSIEAQVLK